VTDYSAACLNAADMTVSSMALARRVFARALRSISASTQDSTPWSWGGSPSSAYLFRAAAMSSAISQNPDQEFEVKPPPLEVSYEE